MVRAGPGFARTRTFLSSGFKQAMWLRSGDALADAKRRAPRRIAREKCDSAQYWPLRVISSDSE